jgi:hypothetical protein
MRRWVADEIDPGTVAAPGERIVEWLRALRRLNGVPLGYLVPDTDMLPPESLRFFAVDADWLDALCDGALSLRDSGAADSQLRRRALQLATAGEDLLTGFLLRSVAVWRWPKIEIQAFTGDDRKPAEPLREDRPAPDVLLALYRGTLREVRLAEPARTLQARSRDALVIPRDERRRVDLQRLVDETGAATPAELARRLVVGGARIHFPGPPSEAGDG